MSPTLYAAFDEPFRAEAAVAALLHRGLDARDISLIAKKPAEKISSATDEPNPAQDDYPRREGVSPSAFSSSIPNASRMYNTGLETRDYDREYDQNVEKEIERDYERDRALANDDLGGPEGSEVERSPTSETVPPNTGEPHRKTSVDRQSIPEPKNVVAASAGLGIGIGALAAAAVLAVPGAGLVIGGGILASGVAALAASSKAGINADSIASFLKDQDVPAEAIPKLRDAYESGGAVLSVGLDKHSVPALEIERIVRQYSPSQVRSYGYAA